MCGDCYFNQREKSLKPDESRKNNVQAIPRYTRNDKKRLKSKTIIVNNNESKIKIGKI